MPLFDENLVEHLGNDLGTLEGKVSAAVPAIQGHSG